MEYTINKRICMEDQVEGSIFIKLKQKLVHYYDIICNKGDPPQI